MTPGYMFPDSGLDSKYNTHVVTVRANHSHPSAPHPTPQSEVMDDATSRRSPLLPQIGPISLLNQQMAGIWTPLARRVAIITPLSPTLNPELTCR